MHNGAVGHALYSSLICFPEVLEAFAGLPSTLSICSCFIYSLICALNPAQFSVVSCGNLMLVKLTTAANTQAAIGVAVEV